MDVEQHGVRPLPRRHQHPSVDLVAVGGRDNQRLGLDDPGFRPEGRREIRQKPQLALVEAGYIAGGGGVREADEQRVFGCSGSGDHPVSVYQEGVAACGAEFEQFHGPLGVVQHQGRVLSAQRDEAAGRIDVHVLGIAERPRLSARGRHDVQNCVLRDEIQAGNAQVLGGEEQPFPVPRLAGSEDGLRTRVGRLDRHGLTAAGGNPVDAGGQILVAPVMERGHEVHPPAVAAKGLTGVI